MNRKIFILLFLIYTVLIIGYQYLFMGNIFYFLSIPIISEFIFPYFRNPGLDYWGEITIKTASLFVSSELAMTYLILAHPESYNDSEARLLCTYLLLCQFFVIFASTLVGRKWRGVLIFNEKLRNGKLIFFLTFVAFLIDGGFCFLEPKMKCLLGFALLFIDSIFLLK